MGISEDLGIDTNGDLGTVTGGIVTGDLATGGIVTGDLTTGGIVTRGVDIRGIVTRGDFGTGIDRDFGMETIEVVVVWDIICRRDSYYFYDQK